MWLAIQSEVQDEAAKLKEAMEVSLREQQAAREAEEAAPPIALLSEERLRKKFLGSAVLARLDAVLPSWVLFSERMPLREKVKHKVGPAQQHPYWVSLYSTLHTSIMVFSSCCAL